MSLAAACRAARPRMPCRERDRHRHEPWPAPGRSSTCACTSSAAAPTAITCCRAAMQFIDLCDELQLLPAAGRRRSSASAAPADIPADTDLIVRAARLLATRYECSHGVGIELHKAHSGARRAWAAAAPMRRRCWSRSIELWQPGFDRSTSWPRSALTLGADVPFFVRGHGRVGRRRRRAARRRATSRSSCYLVRQTAGRE